MSENKNSQPQSHEHGQAINEAGQEAESILFDPAHFNGDVIEDGLRYLRPHADAPPHAGAAVLVGGIREKHESRSQGTQYGYKLPRTDIPLPDPQVALMDSAEDNPHELKNRFTVIAANAPRERPAYLGRKNLREVKVKDHITRRIITFKKDDQGNYTEATHYHPSAKEERPATIEEVQLALNGLRGFVATHNNLRNWEREKNEDFKKAAQTAYDAEVKRFGSKLQALFGGSSAVNRRAMMAYREARKRKYHQEYVERSQNRKLS